MNQEVELLRLQDSWRECERHIHHLFYSMKSLQILFPLSGEIYQSLNDEQIQDIDQFIFRFTKLQDAIGIRLFPAVLGYLKEPFENRPMIDKLNRLEKLGYIERAEEWHHLRSLRNQLAHEYGENEDKNAEVLNLAFSFSIRLYEILDRVSQMLIYQDSNLNLGHPLSPLPSSLVNNPES